MSVEDSDLNHADFRQPLEDSPDRKVGICNRLLKIRLDLAPAREVAIPQVNRSGMPFQLQLARELVQNQSVVNNATTGPESK
jgi:hypothetical protein